MTTELTAAFQAKVRASDCLVWIGATNNQGYGVIVVEGKHHLAHRVAFAAEFGPIADGYVIDHLCRVRNCVNPMHLEAVTTAENNRRGRRARGLAVGDTCNNGHVIGEGDLYERSSGATECQHCRRSCNHSGKDRKRSTTQRRAPRVLDDLEAAARAG
ncbi:MAG: hypothetical protein JWP74_1715 [Marmoricola sp.]|nr:hypothetical protein [Marmoricola sp.]